MKLDEQGVRQMLCKTLTFIPLYVNLGVEGEGGVISNQMALQ